MKEWVPGPTLKGNSTSDGCIIHCTMQVMISSAFNPWNRETHAATIRHHQAVLDVASNLPKVPKYIDNEKAP